MRGQIFYFTWCLMGAAEQDCGGVSYGSQTTGPVLRWPWGLAEFKAAYEVYELEPSPRKRTAVLCQYTSLSPAQPHVSAWRALALQQLAFISVFTGWWALGPWEVTVWKEGAAFHLCAVRNARSLTSRRPQTCSLMPVRGSELCGMANYYQ